MLSSHGLLKSGFIGSPSIGWKVGIGCVRSMIMLSASAGAATATAAAANAVDRNLPIIPSLSCFPGYGLPAVPEAYNNAPAGGSALPGLHDAPVGDGGQ